MLTEQEANDVIECVGRLVVAWLNRVDSTESRERTFTVYVSDPGMRLPQALFGANKAEADVFILRHPIDDRGRQLLLQIHQPIFTSCQCAVD